MKRFFLTCLMCVLVAPVFSQSQWNKTEFLMSVQQTAALQGAEAALGLYKGIPARYAGDYDIFFLRARLLYDTGRYMDAKSVCDMLMQDKANASKAELCDLLARLDATGQAESPAQNWSKDEFIAAVLEAANDQRIDDALTLYEGIPARFVGDYDIFILQAKLLNVAGSLDDALSVAQMLRRTNGDTDELSALIASIQRRKFMQSLQDALYGGTAEDALALYDDLPDALSDDFEIRFIQASLMVSAKQLDQADALCSQLEKVRPNDTDLMALRLAIADMKGDSAAKSAQIMKIIKVDPYNVEANVELAEQSITKKNYNKAKELYEKALVKEPDNESALLGVGLTDYYLQKDNEAKDVLYHLLEVNPNNPQAYSYLGKLAYANNEYVVAAENVEKAIAIDPSNYDYFTDYGLYLRYLGRFDDAEQAWTHAISLQPDYFLGYVYRAGLYDEQEMIPQALADYKKVIELNPKYYYAYESIGVLALHEEDYTTAREAFLKCREYNTTNISYPLMVTYCYYKEGNKLEAKNYSNQILRRMDRNTIEYAMLRVFHDETGEMPLPQRIASMTSMNERAKMYFYMGLFYDMFGGKEIANSYYARVVNMNSPMFFEYRLAEWSIQES